MRALDASRATGRLQRSLAALALSAATLAFVALAPSGARAQDIKYPDLKGSWTGIGADLDAAWDPSKPPGNAQQAPLTPEYQKIYEQKLADRKAGTVEPTTCLPPGMPRSMMVYQPMEIIVMPDTTYVMLTYMNEFRRIYTDGRKWPDDLEPSYAGYSIGQWSNEDGRAVLTVETRAMKGPRTFDASGLPLDKDNDTVVKERIYLDRNDLNILHDQVTTMDKALTKPWTVTRSFARERHPVWDEFVCSEDNHTVQLGKEVYVISDQGLLSPTRAGQPAPDLKYFKPKK